MSTLEIMKNERACVLRASMPFGCDRVCENCDLLRPTDEILKAYDDVIGLLEKGEDDRK